MRLNLLASLLPLASTLNPFGKGATQHNKRTPAMLMESILDYLQTRRMGRRINHGYATRRMRFETFEVRRMLSFTAVGSFPVGTNPQAVATADFNNDGRLDVSTASYDGGSVSVLLGNGLGALGAAINSAAGNNPVSLAVGDFNRDGRPDLVTANHGGNDVSVLLGNGNGTFQNARHINIGSGPTSVAVGDLNGDGKLDLGVVSNLHFPDDPLNPYTGQATILLGTGDGSFSGPRVNSLRDDAYYTCGVIADFNGDGYQDMVNGNDLGEVRFLMGTGQGGWFAEFFGGVTVGPPSSLAAGDVNGDHKLDVVVASRGGNAVSVLRGNGAGGFATEQYAAGNGPASVAMGDFNRDGWLDIVTANFGSNDVSILLGRGDGTFSAAETFAAGPGATAVAAGDFNGDGWLDLAAANASGNTVSVLINDRIWAPAPAAISVNDVTVTEGNHGTTNATFTLTLSKAAGVNVTVHYSTADLTALAGSDYVAAAGTVTFSAGQTSRTITVAVIGDRLAEPTERFAMNLSSPTNAVIGDGQGIGTINDNDRRIIINAVFRREGQANRTSIFPLTVNKREPNETFYLDLFGLSSNALFTKNRGIGTILNDDH